ncbi:hypothetical protein JOD24_001513 [Kroppenstedtia sanguinis]|uniref:Phr family secreted Rap phosphatase inhibitor n=1 Tax=Kroppenstedtia sanguinis TaxID=1380684 RepID=A0ABW4CBZ8_9BACL
MKWIKKGMLVFSVGMILAIGAYYGAVEKVSNHDLITDNRPNGDDPAGV